MYKNIEYNFITNHDNEKYVWNKLVDIIYKRIKIENETKIK